MKKILLTIFSLMILCSNAYAIPCDFISNSDLKHFCRALKEKSVSECNFIQDNDIKYGCLAEISKNTSYCSFIRDKDLEYLCRVRSEL